MGQSLLFVTERPSYTVGMRTEETSGLSEVRVRTVVSEPGYCSGHQNKGGGDFSGNTFSAGVTDFPEDGL